MTSHISELELVAFVTPTQKHFADIAERVAMGEQYRVNITVTELKGARCRTTRYEDCLLARYELPRLKANSDRLVTERAIFQATSGVTLPWNQDGCGHGDHVARMSAAQLGFQVGGIGDLPSVLAADLGGLVMELTDSTQGDEPAHVYGLPHVGEVTVAFSPGQDTRPDTVIALSDWVASAQANPDDPASLRDVTARIKVGHVARIWNAKECFPVSFSPGGVGKDGRTMPAVLRVQPSHFMDYVEE